MWQLLHVLEEAMYDECATHSFLFLGVLGFLEGFAW